METNMAELFTKLSAPFHPHAIHWRVGATTNAKDKGIALAYLDARDVMERLDEVVGPGNWQRRYPWSDGKRLCCEIGIRVGDTWVWKGDGSGETDYEAEKGAFSAAFKRAAVSWGVGRYLYDLPNIWFPIQSRGKSYTFTPEAEKEMTQRLAAWQEKKFQRAA